MRQMLSAITLRATNPTAADALAQGLFRCPTEVQHQRPCGHVQMVKCFVDAAVVAGEQSLGDCPEKVKYLKPCGHRLPVTCALQQKYAAFPSPTRLCVAAVSAIACISFALKYVTGGH